MSLVNYSSSSSSCESDAQVEQSEPPESKKPKIEEATGAAGTSSSQKPLLPSALSQLGDKKNDNAEELETEDPTKHDGRVRSFKHERGNWATYVYVPVDKKILEDVDECQALVAADDIELHIMDNLHLSLSRTVVLLYHQIEPVVKYLRDSFKPSESFKLYFHHLKVYTNAERTRTFVAFHADAVYLERLRDLTRKVDAVFSDFNLPLFYEDPSFHTSFLWCLGDKVTALTAYLDKFKEILDVVRERERFAIDIKEIHLKSGFKDYTVWLKQ